MVSSLLVLSLVLAISAAAQSGATVSPARLDTDSSENVYYTVYNQSSIPLFNVSVTLPPGLTPVGAIANTGKWYPIARAVSGEGYAVSWFGGPIEPGQAATFGIAILTPGKPSAFTSNVILAYSTNQTTTSSVTLTVGCPCFLGIDLRYFAYWLVGGVFILPVLELGLSQVRKRVRNESQPHRTGTNGSTSPEAS